MPSRTSFFNKKLFCKTLGRFWPLWTGYLAFWLLAMLSFIEPKMQDVEVCWHIMQSAGLIGVAASFLMSCAAALAVFGFMYTPRSAGGMACLPVKRESVFLSCALAGLLPMLLAHALTAAVCCLAAGVRGIACIGALWQWAGAVSLEAVFFFGFAAFCAQLTGSAAILPAVYTVLSFTAKVVEVIVRDIISTFVYGMSAGDSALLTFLSPPVYLCSAVGAVYTFDDVSCDYTAVHMAGAAAAAVYAAAGLILLLAAMALYRRRRMEAAGDIVAVRVLRPVFKYCMTFGCAIVLGDIAYGTLGVGSRLSSSASLAVMLLLLLAGAFIGYYGSQMLMKKSFRVFRGGLPGLFASALLLSVLMLAAGTGFFGFESRVPAQERISGVELSANGETIVLSEPDSIAAVTALHSRIIDGRDYNLSFSDGSYFPDETVVSLRLRYELSGGSSISRTYMLGYEDDTAEESQLPQLQELFNCAEAIAYRKQTSIPISAETVFAAQISSIVPADDAGRYSPDGEGWSDDESACLTYELSPEEAAELYAQCIVPDMDDGSIGKIWFITDDDYRASVSRVTISIDVRKPADSGSEPYVYDYFYTTPTVSSERTNAWLEAHGIPVYLIQTE